MGEASCEACPANSYSAQTGQSSCDCDAGYTGSAGTCTACVAGKYKTVTGSAECSNCDAGKFSASSIELRARSAEPARTRPRRVSTRRATTARPASSRHRRESTWHATAASLDDSLQIQAAPIATPVPPASSRKMRRNQFAVANAPTASTPLSAERLHQAYVKNARSARTETPRGHPRVTHALLTKLRRLPGIPIRLPASAYRGTRGTALPESARRGAPHAAGTAFCL